MLLPTNFRKVAVEKGRREPGCQADLASFEGEASGKIKGEERAKDKETTVMQPFQLSKSVFSVVSWCAAQPHSRDKNESSPSVWWSPFFWFFPSSGSRDESLGRTLFSLLLAKRALNRSRRQRQRLKSLPNCSGRRPVCIRWPPSRTLQAARHAPCTFEGLRTQHGRP